jgi:hypothetical protein
MEDFYAALEKFGLEADDIAVIRAVFVEQRIKFWTLASLTDEKLKEAGIKQLGLREAILAFVGK